MKHVEAEYIPGTTRRRVISDGGKALERQQIYLPAKCWAALKTMSWEQSRGGSQILEDLILLAYGTSTTKGQPTKRTY